VEGFELSNIAEHKMKLLVHSESHIVKLSDGSVWQIFPGDIDLTLGWQLTTELQLFEINDRVAPHGLIKCDDGSVVRVRPPGERWPEDRVKALFKQGANLRLGPAHNVREPFTDAWPSQARRKAGSLL